MGMNYWDIDYYCPPFPRNNEIFTHNLWIN